MGKSFSFLIRLEDTAGDGQNSTPEGISELSTEGTKDQVLGRKMAAAKTRKNSAFMAKSILSSNVPPDEF